MEEVDSSQLKSSISLPSVHPHWMVLEAKSISYGTLNDSTQQQQPPPTHSAFLHVTQLINQAEDNSLNLRRNVTNEMTQDVYQRQPLLSSSSKGEGWETGEEYSSSSEPSTFYDSKLSNSSGGRSNGSVVINGLNKTNGGIGINGTQLESAVIRIDMPAPNRDEPKFPREYIKTIVGISNTFSTLYVSF